MFKIKTSPLDKLFSQYIRRRDNYTCQVCQKEFGGLDRNLHCAHCYSRSTLLTRWDPHNAVAACFNCHIGPRNEFALDRNVQEKYNWFKKRLGDERFQLLEWMYRRPWDFPKVDKKAIQIWLEHEIDKLEEKEIVIGQRPKTKRKRK